MRGLALAVAVAAVAGAAGCGGAPPSGGPGTTIAMSFPRAGGLYDAPFPSDDLRRADGRVDLSKFPNPGAIPLATQALGLLDGARGFAQTAAIYFRASNAIDPTSLPDRAGSVAASASVFVVGIDPAQPDFLVRRPLDVAFLADGGPFGDRDLIALLPIQGLPLRPRARYAAVLTRAVRDAQGRALIPSAAMSDLAARRGSTALGLDAATASLYQDALDALGRGRVDGSQIVGLAVFTTGEPTADLAKLRQSALARPPASIPPPTSGEVFDDYCVYDSTIAMPVYQRGTAPYAREGGAWTFDAGGAPIVDHVETARVVFTVPRAKAPAGGWPTVVFVRTGGGGDRPLVERGVCADPDFTHPIVPGSGPARDFARIGFAGVQVDGPLGGMRNPTGADEEFLIFNVFNPPALRDNIRQSALELALLPRSLAAVAIDTRGCPGAGATAKLDLAHLAIMGHSMGAWIAPLTLAVEPAYGAAILSGAGGSYIANILDKIKPTHVRPLLEVLLFPDGARALAAHDPVLSLIQWAAEPSDPQVYGATIAREPIAPAPARHVLMLQGIVDHYILPSIANTASLSLGLDLAGPPVDQGNAEEAMLGQLPLGALLPLGGLRAIALPARGNVGGTTTAVVVQHAGDTVEDGHEVVFQTEPPKHQYRCFLASWRAGVPSVPPDDREDAPCP